LPPTRIGGYGSWTGFGDEWMPNRVSGLRERICKLQELAQHAGREPIPVTLSGAKPDPELIERGAEAGIHRCTFYIRPADPGETERQLDALAGTLGLG
jgi:hypothetical protein